MALIVEDGTGVANANTYVDLAFSRAYALDRGIALTNDDTALSVLIIKAKDYIEAQATRFVGMPVVSTQALSWPRVNVLNSDSTPFPSNAIPVNLKSAQAQCVIEQNNGITLLPTIDPAKGGFVLRRKIDVIERQFSERIGTTREPVMFAVDALLQPLYRNRAASGGIQVIRA